MFQRTIVLIATLTCFAGAVLLAPSASDTGSIPNYQPVANWPRLPENIKLGQVTAVDIDAADRVYVFHRGKNPLLVFDRDGKFLRTWGEGLIKNAHGLRLDPDGNIWVTDLDHHLVMKFNPQGKVMLTLGEKGKAGEDDSHFNKPADIAFGAGGDIYIADGYGNSRVAKFSKDGRYLKAWGKKGKQEGEFNLPHAICIDAMGKIYVGDRENNRIQVFDGDGKFLAQWKDTGAPFGLFLTRDRKLLLADGRAHLAKVLDLAGKSVGHWGKQGTAPGEFALPHGICMDSKGAVYVAEIKGQRVQKFVAGL